MAGWGVQTVSRGNPPGRSSANQLSVPAEQLTEGKPSAGALNPEGRGRSPRDGVPAGPKLFSSSRPPKPRRRAQDRPARAAVLRPVTWPAPAPSERRGRRTAVVSARRCLAGRGDSSRPGTYRARSAERRLTSCSLWTRHYSGRKKSFRKAVATPRPPSVSTCYFSASRWSVK